MLISLQKLILQEIEGLAALSSSATVSIEVKRYLYDVLTFLRVHRAVAAGITPRATKHFELLVRSMAPLHGMSFATPSLVQLAATKIYRHRIILRKAEEDISLQYGSDPQAVASMLDSYDANTIIDEVVQNIEVPL